MIGASKINEKTDDLERLHEMFNLGLNDYQIARVYKTNSGKSISRTHIGRIRRGKRWNEKDNSFLMKSQIKNLGCISSKIDSDIYRTDIGIIFSKNVEFYVFMTFKNNKYCSDIISPFLLKKPTHDELIEFHKQIIPAEQ